MRRFKGTPGPWKAESNSAFMEVRNEDWHKKDLHMSINIYLFDREIDGHHLSEENKANGYLIAAAPKLLEALLYYFDVLKEVRGENWADKPDHVLVKMLDAVDEALNTQKIIETISQ